MRSKSYMHLMKLNSSSFDFNISFQLPFHLNCVLSSHHFFTLHKMWKSPALCNNKISNEVKWYWCWWDTNGSQAGLCGRIWLVQSQKVSYISHFFNLKNQICFVNEIGRYDYCLCSMFTLYTSRRRAKLHNVLWNVEWNPQQREYLCR